MFVFTPSVSVNMQLLLLHLIILFILALLRVQGRPELFGILLIDDSSRPIDDLFSFLLGFKLSAVEAMFGAKV